MRRLSFVPTMLVSLFLAAACAPAVSPAAGLDAGKPVTIVGTTGCLPKKGDGPVTLECRLGLQAEDGDHYDLDLTEVAPDELPLLLDGQRARVTGTLFEPRPDTTYDVVGVVTVGEMELVEDAPSR